MTRRILPGLVLVLAACGTTLVGSRYVKAEQVDATRGAVITVTVADSPALAGTQLDIPANALAATTTITVEPALQPLVTDGDGVSPAVIWGPAGLLFSSPATMTLPVALASGDAVSDLEVVVEESDGTVFAIPSVGLDDARTHVTFKVTGFSAYQVRRRPGRCSATTACPVSQTCVNGSCRVAASDGGVSGRCTTDVDCGVSQQCVSGVCSLRCVPTAEVCDGRDNDCNGVIDDGCTTNPVDGGLGCQTNADCGSAGQCVRNVCLPLCTPSPEICGDGIDNDCNGVIDDGCGMMSCRSSADCPATLSCFNGVCSSCSGPGGCGDAGIDGGSYDGGVDGGLQCGGSVACPAGEACVAGQCVCSGVTCGVDAGPVDGGPAQCSSNASCAAGQVCVSGQCVCSGIACGVDAGRPDAGTDGGTTVDGGVRDGGTSVDAGPSTDGGLKPDAGVCRTNADCVVGQACIAGICG
jgi:hypothetical protein